MHGSVGDENNAAGPNYLGSSIVLERDGPLLHDDDLGVLDSVRRVGHRASRLFGLVNRHNLSRRQSALQNVPHLPAVRHLVWGQLFKRIHPGLRQRTGRCGLRFSRGTETTNGNGQGNTPGGSK